MSRSATWFRTHAGRRDKNHAAIRDGLRALGHMVIDTAAVGGGVPDLVAYPRVKWARAADDLEALAALPTPVWLELKAGKGRLRASQLKWRTAALNAGLRVATVRTLEEAIGALR
jgi:hypothetical protein